MSSELKQIIDSYLENNSRTTILDIPLDVYFATKKKKRKSSTAMSNEIKIINFPSYNYESSSILSNHRHISKLNI